MRSQRKANDIYIARWHNEKDGDLWQKFWAAKCLRGIGATRLTKMNGHATQESVDMGLATEVDRHANDTTKRW